MGASYHDQTKLSLSIEVDGDKENSKKLNCLQFNVMQSFAPSAEVCENKDYQTQVYEQDLRGPGIGQDVMLAVILGKRENCTVIRGHFHWVEIT